MTAFFVPGVAMHEAELVYTRLAAMCGCQVPPPPERIRKIHWTNDGDDWVAEVGRQLHGRRVRVRRRGRDFVEVTTPLRDPATVRAIFPGDSFIVVTDARPTGPFLSYWNNPFIAGRPTAVHKFVLSGSQDE